MRVLLITDKSLPQHGGSQMVFHHAYEGFESPDLALVSRFYSEAAGFDARRRSSVTRVRYPNIPKVRIPALCFSLGAAIPRMVRTYGPDQVHCGQALETAWIGWLCKRRYGLPYLVHTFLEELTTYGRGRLTGRLIRKVLRDADAVTAVSRYTEALLVDLGVDRRRIHLLYPGVTTPTLDPDSANALRRELGLGNKKVLLTVGRLVPRKGHDAVIRTLPRVLARHPSVVYLVVGQGSERQRLEQLATSLGVRDRVTFTGPVADPSLYYQVADLFVMPNRELANGDVEGFGMVFLEANAAGLAVIGGRSGGTADAILDQQTGWLVDSGDESKLEQTINFALDNPDRCRRMGAAGKERVACEFTWDRAAKVVRGLADELSSLSRAHAVPGESIGL